MSRATSHRWNPLRALGLAFAIAALAPVAASALTVVPFAPVRGPLTNEIAELESRFPELTREERARLRVLKRADAVFDDSAQRDGKALRKIKAHLNRYPDYVPRLDAVASNLVHGYTIEYVFVGFLLEQVPPSPIQREIQGQYDGLSNVTSKLTNNPNAMMASALYDPAKRRLDNILFRANDELLIPFPSDLETNSVEARIDNGSGPKNFKVSSTAASSDLVSFQAVRTGDTVNIVLSAVDSTRGILFSIPNAALGQFRYDVPVAASFTNRTDFNFFSVPPASTDTGATAGAIFVGTTATEVFGVFECSGPGFTVTEGRFRINITTSE